MAIADLSLTVAAGELFALVGPDGAGKSTTLRLLTGIMDPEAGRLRILGWDPVREAEKLKEEIGYMPQRFGLYDDLTVLENLTFYADIYRVSKQERRQRLPELLAFAGLDRFQDRLAAHLSGGMRQKLGLICTLIHQPRLIFLDEPTFGVDPVSRREFWRILSRLLREGMTIFLSTSYLDEAERATRVGLLYEGRLLLLGTPQALKAGYGGGTGGNPTGAAAGAAAAIGHPSPGDPDPAVGGPTAAHGSRWQERLNATPIFPKAPGLAQSPAPAHQPHLGRCFRPGNPPPGEQ